jgi:hypothetical protein
MWPAFLLSKQLPGVRLQSSRGELSHISAKDRNSKVGGVV